MMKNILISIGVLVLSASVVAGGDDRDKGPVESLDTIQPVTEQFVGNQAPERMEPAMGNQPVAVGTHVTHINCQDKLGLSESNIAIFKKAQLDGYLYNIGPLDSFGTGFSPMRWDDYFNCVHAHGG